MKLSEKNIAIGSQEIGAEPGWENRELENRGLIQSLRSRLLADSEFQNVVATFLTTLAIFGIYLFQGIIVARILLPEGRGEFGTAMFFPRDVFLYAGLFGGIEIVNSYAVTGFINIRSLKFSAAKVGLISGTVTAVLAGIVSVIVMLFVGKSYLIPFCLLCCLFVPFEHMQLTISAVDRGSRNFRFYNVNRLLYASTFLVMVVAVFGLKINTLIGLSPLPMICVLFVVSRIVGIVPTLRGMHVWQTWTGSSNDSSSSHETKTDQASSTPGAATEVDVPSPRMLLWHGRFYALSMLVSEIFEKLDMFLIVAIATVTESGFYFVAVPAAQLLTIAPNALAVFTFNAGAEKTRRITLRKAITVMAGTAVLQTISAVILSMLIPFLIILFYKSDYEPAIPFALWLLPASAMKGYLQAIDGYLKGRGKPMIGGWARFVSIFAMLAFVGTVYAGLVPGPETKLLCIPMSACLGQAISMVIISTAVIFDTIEREKDFGSAAEEVENVSR